MRRKAKKRLSMYIALVAAISLAATSTAFAEGWRVGSVSNGDEDAVYSVGNYTFTSEPLQGTKLILEDPELSEKSWVEYVEYSLLNEVQDGDVKYYIYQPTDYAASSIMAIKDYNPDSITGSSTNLSVSLGDLSSIFEAASLGTGISSRLLGSSMSADTIAAAMTSTPDIVKNSKYYATPSFMGIPGDREYTGVSNDGYYNASSMSISLTKSSSVQVTKTNTTNASLSVGSSESSSTSLSNTKQSSNSRTVSNTSSSNVGTSSTSGSSNTKSNSVTIGATSTSTNSNSAEISSSQEASVSETIGISNATKIGMSTEVSAGFNSGVATGGVKEGFSVDNTTTISSTTQIGAKMSLSEKASWQTSNSNSTSASETTSGSSTDSNSTTISASTAVSDAISNANSTSNSSSSSTSGTQGTSASSSIGYGLNYA